MSSLSSSSSLCSFYANFIGVGSLLDLLALKMVASICWGVNFFENYFLDEYCTYSSLENFSSCSASSSLICFYGHTNLALPFFGKPPFYTTAEPFYIGDELIPTPVFWPILNGEVTGSLHDGLVTLAFSRCTDDFPSNRLFSIWTRYLFMRNSSPGERSGIDR